MRLLESTKIKVTRDKNSEEMQHLEITELVLVHCNIVNNDYQNDSRVLYAFVSNKSFGQLLDISPKKTLHFQKPLIQTSHILKYGLLIKTLNH